jgi:hypothetical protein
MATNLTPNPDLFEDTPQNVVDDATVLPELPKPEDVMTPEAAAEESLQIEVVDDVPAEDRRPAKAADADYIDPESQELKDEIEKYGEGAKKRFDQLTYRYHEERRAREAQARQNDEAVRFAEQMARENQALKQALDNHTATLSEQLDEKNAALLERAKEAYRTAYDNGDGEALVAAQEQMSALYAERMARSAKAQSHPNAPSPEPAPVVPQAETYPTVPDSKATAWLQKNTWFQQPGYEDMSGYALGLHEKLVKQGLDPRVHDEYYTRIDTTLRAAFPDYFAEDQGRQGVTTPVTPAATPQRKAAPVAAPTRGGKAPRKVQLTSTQVALAKRLGITKEQYAAQVAKEMANG